MKKFFLCTLLFLMLAHDSFSQQVYQFTSGLIARTGYRYGREALYTDPLAFRLYTNSLTTPTEGAVYGKAENGESITWQPVKADSLFRLRGQGRGGGFGLRGGGSYIYLTYQSAKAQPALLNIRGNSGLYLNGVPHMGDAYSSGFLYIPVSLKKGLNEFYVRGTFIIASLIFPSKAVTLNTTDPTLPSILLDGTSKTLQAAVVVLNTSNRDLKGLQMRSIVEGREMTSALPVVPAMSSRKVAFQLDGSGVNTAGNYRCTLSLLENGKSLDTGSIVIDAVPPTAKYSTTFVSGIDGSLQYYAVAPQINYKPGSALFLSVHGAGVEAIGQARAYKSKDWGTLVAATNRRPRGFNWEDWGRIDALEVFNMAKDRFKPDPQQIYLTGHSMGGHGTWFLGATYPDKWAAIAPCAGYPTLKGYGSADGIIPDSSTNPLEQMLIRSSNQSDVVKLATNYKPLGVYVFHGDADRTVPVTYARQMRKVLADFHPDLSYYEYPGGEHWFGDHSVDWKPLFDFFQWHKLAEDSAVHTIDFSTASPGISAAYRWAAIQQQLQPLVYSRIQLNRNRRNGSISGTTTNVRLLKLDLTDFNANTGLTITLDQQEPVRYTTKNNQDSLLLVRENGKWTAASSPDAYQKGPHRYGTFKDAFNHNMVFVYGTTGTREENEWSLNKARYDAETWYYRGNGAVDIIADKAFSLQQYKDRGVIIFGNKTTNTAWKQVLSDCPIQVERNKIQAGSKTWTGDDLAAYFVWPIKSSAHASVGVVTGTGVNGMKAAYANQYFAGASGFPDFMIYGLTMLQSGANEVKMAGFFSHDWKLDADNYVERN